MIRTQAKSLERICPALADDGAPLRGRRRRGAVTVWLILLLPVLVILLGVVLEIAHLSLARVELENALEASALAAVKQWGDEQGLLGTTNARNVGVEFAQLNTLNGVPIEIGTNLGSNPTNNPNLNRLCDYEKSDMDLGTPRPGGNLIFGAITNDNPLTFDASIGTPSCDHEDVLIEVVKPNAGSDSQPRAFGVFYRNGTLGNSIMSVSITIPDFAVPDNQQPYWSGDFGTPGQAPVVSLFNSPDSLNLNNTSPASISPAIGAVSSTHDARGMNPAPTVPNAGQPQNSDWSAFNPNGSGVGFAFSDQVGALTDRYRTVTIRFNPNEFEPPSNPADPDTWEFIRFGVALHGLGPPAITGGDAGVNNNDGDIFEQAGVTARVDFWDGTFCATDFINTGDNSDGRSEAQCGPVSSLDFAVRAQAEVLVRPIFSQFSGINIGPFCVSAVTTARYRCMTGQPELIRVERQNVICGPGLGADP